MDKFDDRAIIEILKRIKDPETGLDIVSEGLVYGFTVNELKTEIWMSFESNTPVCYFCKLISWALIQKITQSIVEEFSKSGYINIKVVEALNPKIYYNLITGS
ncbi:MAG: iron-sulfur cluster assembly protein [Caldisericaceae bacterium]